MGRKRRDIRLHRNIKPKVAEIKKPAPIKHPKKNKEIEEIEEIKEK